MDNKEKILQLEQSVLSMREEMTALKEKLGCMMKDLESEELLGEAQAIALRQQMEHLLVSQEAFLKECAALQFTNGETSLISWEGVLAEQLKRSEKEVYRRVIDFVCRLQVSNIGMMEYLSQLRDEVQALDVDAMSKEELNGALAKYMSLQEAFFEADQKKRFMRVMALGSSFNTEFLYCINTGELTIMEEEQEPEPIAEVEPENAAEAAVQEEPEPIAEAEPENAAEASAQEESELVAEAEPENAAEAAAVQEESEPIAEAEPENAAEAASAQEESEPIAETEPENAAEEAPVQEKSEEIPAIELDAALMRQAMISESSLNFIEEASEKEETRFYAKVFQADVCGSSERRKCLSKAFELNGVTARLMANIMGKSELLFEGACSSLFRNGYFRRYSISGYEPFYYLSKKGYEAFKNEEAIVYLQAERQLDDAAFCQHDSLSVLTWHYIEAAMNYIHEDPRAENCTYEIVSLQKNAFAIVFAYGKGEMEQKLMITGIASEQEQDFMWLFGKISQYIDTVKRSVPFDTLQRTYRYVVYGVHEEQVQATAGLLSQLVEGSAVAYTIGDSEIYYDFITQDTVDILEGEAVEEDAVLRESTEEIAVEELALEKSVEEAAVEELALEKRVEEVAVEETALEEGMDEAGQAGMPAATGSVDRAGIGEIPRVGVVSWVANNFQTEAEAEAESDGKAAEPKGMRDVLEEIGQQEADIQDIYGKAGQTDAQDIYGKAGQADVQDIYGEAGQQEVQARFVEATDGEIYDGAEEATYGETDEAADEGVNEAAYEKADEAAYEGEDEAAYGRADEEIYEGADEAIDEEMDLEIPTIMLDIQTDDASLSSVLPDTSEEAYADVYCQMLCDGNIYCATAYLKAAAMAVSSWETEYKQLAYAVNDPMEACSYTANKLSEIYLTETANEYYFVSAMLRLLFFDHETDTRTAKEILASLEDGELLQKHSGLKSVMHVLLDYKDENQTSIGHYGMGTGADKKVRDELTATMNQAASELAADRHSQDKRQAAGNAVLMDTLTELRSRLNGSYTKYGNKYFYIGFLAGDAVALDAGFMPVLEEQISLLPELSPTERIAAHSKREMPADETAFKELLKQRLEHIVNDGGDFSSAQCIIKYIKDVHPEEANAVNAAYNEEIAVSKAKRSTELVYNRFIGNLEASQSYGTPENIARKETMLWIADRWYSKTEEALNFGFFKRILYALNEKAGEDLLKPLQKKDAGRAYEGERADYLKDFWEVYEDIYAKVQMPGYTLQMLLDRSGIYRECVAGQCLADNWLKNAGNAGEDSMKVLIQALGFGDSVVSQQPSIDEKLENYLVMPKKRKNGRRYHYAHPISVFGSQAEKDGFCVVCLHGVHDSDNLVKIFQEIGNAKHCLILLDHALPAAERRSLARKAKQAANGRIYAVLDRVALVYLMQRYQEDTVNRILMAVTMPFTSCQPYVVDFSKGMPQEIFIGRRTELAQVKAPDGVSIVYGGRHLGKSALLRMARKAIDHDENHNRAALINIKGMNFRRAVKNVYKEMCREGILAEGRDVEEWDVLAALIDARLEQEQDAIPYLLLMLDEADAFIKSCSASAYAPIAELEKLQIKFQGRFKFVVAGLKNVVRFEEMMKAKRNSVFPMLKSLTVKPFRYEEARELLEVPLSYAGFSIPEKEQTETMLSTVFRTTHYFPGMLQLYCSMLLNPEDIIRMYNEKNVPPYELREGHMKRVLADAELHKKIKEELRATLRVDDEGYYYMIALLAAVWHHANGDLSDCDAGDILHMAEKYKIARIQVLGRDQINTLMEEMYKLNALQKTEEGRYRISGFRFYRIMGTEEEIKNKLMQYVTNV